MFKDLTGNLEDIIAFQQNFLVSLQIVYTEFKDLTGNLEDIIAFQQHFLVSLQIVYDKSSKISQAI